VSKKKDADNIIIIIIIITFQKMNSPASLKVHFLDSVFRWMGLADTKSSMGCCFSESSHNSLQQPQPQQQEQPQQQQP
jgi:hypothetical protein